MDNLKNQNGNSNRVLMNSGHPILRAMGRSVIGFLGMLLCVVLGYVCLLLLEAVRGRGGRADFLPLLGCCVVSLALWGVGCRRWIRLRALEFLIAIALFDSLLWCFIAWVSYDGSVETLASLRWVPALFSADVLQWLGFLGLLSAVPCLSGFAIGRRSGAGA